MGNAKNADSYKLENIRALLAEGFTAEELRRFCFDNAKFRPVYDDLAQDTGKAIIIDRLIEHADRKLGFEILLGWAKEQNPKGYETHQPYIEFESNLVASVGDRSDLSTFDRNPLGSKGIQIGELKFYGCVLRNFIIALGVLLVVGLGSGGIGFFVYGGGEGPDRATETAVAMANETGTVVAFTSATETAVAGGAPTATAQSNVQAAAPTQTAQAAETAAALETADAVRIATAVSSGLIAASAATAEAATVMAATVHAATAEALANATPSPGPTDTPLPMETPLPVDTRTPALPTTTPTPASPAATPTPERPPVSGKLAFPVDNGSGKYDVFIYSIPEGQLIGRINNARQPDFRADGQKLLINGEGDGFAENVFEASSNGNIEKPVSDSPADSYPVYSPDGERVAYSNPQLVQGTDGNYHSYIFVQCSSIPPAQEEDKNCRDVARFGILVPNGQVGEIQGSHPVWMETDHIVYKGCNTWQGGGSCGIFITVSWGNKRGGNGNTPSKLGGIEGTSTIPTDSKGNLIAYHSPETGDWEAYVANTSGGKTNISNSPSSNDGLPTLSPDGQWIAFASDREGSWAVFVAPVGGEPAQKLFDFPKANPWGVGDRDWTNERMSWGK